MRNIAECSAPRWAAGKSWVRGAVVAQLATNALWMAPRAYRRQGAAADGSEEVEDGHWGHLDCVEQAMCAEGTWQRAAELRHRVRELLREASRGDSGDEFDEDDEDDFDEEEVPGLGLVPEEPSSSQDDWNDDGYGSEDFTL